MARTKGSRNKSTLEFAQLYDELSQEYGNPVETLFRIQSKKSRYKVEHKIKAAAALLPFKYSRRTEDNKDEGIQGELSLVWDVDADESDAA